MAADEKVPAYLRTHRLRGEVLRFTVGTEERALQAMAASAASGRAAKTLVKDGPLRITLAVLRRDAALEEHQIEGPVSIHTLRGRVRVVTPEGKIELGPGEIAALDAGVAHSAQALEDCTLLITVAMP